MYKSIVKLVIALITQPAKTWAMLNERWLEGKEKDSSATFELFHKSFLYPFMGLLTVVAFLSVCTRQEFNIEYALKSALVTIFSLLGGYFLASHLLNEVWKGYFKRKDDIHLCQLFVGFSSSLMFTLDLVWLLLPDFFFLYIFIVYTFYIVWEGSTIFMGVEREKQMGFTIAATICIVGVPHFIKFLMILFMPGLR